MNRVVEVQKQWVERFSPSIIIAHWIHAISFIMLVVTGLPVFMGYEGFAMGKLLHRIFGVTFIIPTLFIMFTDRAGFVFWTKQLLSWKDYDFKFFTEFPKEFFGIKSNVPKQGFYNAGQKVNSILTILISSVMAVTGLIIWFKASFSAGLAAWMYPLHAAGAALLLAVILGHVFLSIGHPASRPSFRGMTQGKVSVDYAKAHHGRWYDEITKAK
jgi:formate dehydrogenase subunit gamma